MENLFKNEFVSIDYSTNKSLLTLSWSGENENIQKEVLKTIVIKFTELIIQLKPSKILVDHTNQKFIFSVDIQNWVADSVGAAASVSGVKKWAAIMPNELIIELSTEQTVEELSSKTFEIKYFRELNEAFLWLNIIPNS